MKRPTSKHCAAPSSRSLPAPACAPIGPDQASLAAAGRAAAPLLALSLQFADASHREHLPRHRVARWLRAALARPAQITVRIVGAEEGRALNRDYRGQDHATNVLTFDYGPEPVLTADLVLCAPVVEREARAAGKTLAAHYAHLLVHGALHAQGYDHQALRDAKRMQARESELLLALGQPDPYPRACRKTGARPT